MVLTSFNIIAQTHRDISKIVSEYRGAESCIICHDQYSSIDAQVMAQQIVGTTHFAFKSDIGTSNVFKFDGDSNLSNDLAVEGSWGKINRYCGLPGAIPKSNWLGLMQNPNTPFEAGNPVYSSGLPGGCARCHVGNGTLTPAELTSEDAWKTVDCLLCHATTYQVNGSPLPNYGARKVVSDETSPSGFHFPYLSGDDLAVTSSSIVAKPTTKNCQNCHVVAGGGYMNKRGHDYDGSYGDGITDIHSTKLSCIDCHITKDHKIGKGRVKPACWPNDLDGDPDNAKIDCAFCHSTEGQDYFSFEGTSIPIPQHSSLGENAAKHMENIACQTCHIPKNLGLSLKYFDQVVQEKDANGNFMRWKPRGSKVQADNAAPDYMWFNGTVYDNVTPRGAKGDGKIHPFRVVKSKVPVDDATGIVLPVKLGIIFNANAEISNLGGFGVVEGDQSSLIDRAIRIGVKSAAAADETYAPLLNTEGNYTSSYSFHEWDVMNFSVDHGTTSKTETLSCNACHANEGGILDWLALGYKGNPITGISDKTINSSDFGLKQNYPNPVTGKTTIEYNLIKRSKVNISIYNLSGQLVENVISMQQAPGAYKLEVDLSNYTAGVYTYKLSTPYGMDSKILEVFK